MWMLEARVCGLVAHIRIGCSGREWQTRRTYLLQVLYGGPLFRVERISAGLYCVRGSGCGIIPNRKSMEVNNGDR